MDFASWSPSHTILVLFIIGGFIGQIAILFYRTGRLEKRADSTDERIDKQGEMFFHALERLEERMNQRFAEDISILRSEINQQGSDLRSLISQQGSDLWSLISQQGADLRSLISQQGADLRSEISDVRGEIRDLRLEMSKLNQNHIDHLTHHHES